MKSEGKEKTPLWGQSVVGHSELWDANCSPTLWVLCSELRWPAVSSRHMVSGFQLEKSSCTSFLFPPLWCLVPCLAAWQTGVKSAFLISPVHHRDSLSHLTLDSSQLPFHKRGEKPTSSTEPAQKAPGFDWLINYKCVLQSPRPRAFGPGFFLIPVSHLIPRWSSRVFAKYVWWPRKWSLWV